MFGIAKGVIVPSLWLLFSAIGSFIGFRLARQGKFKPQIRRIEALEHIDEAIGRSMEMGKSVHFTAGYAPIGGKNTSMMIAAMTALNYVAEKCAQLYQKLVVTAGSPTTIPIIEDILEEAYISQGESELYNPAIVQFFGDAKSSNRPFAMGVIGYFSREKPGANIMIGAYASESLTIAEVGASIGAMQIGGTARISQIPYLFLVCDYCLICEEIYSISAYLSKDPAQTSSLYIGDLSKSLTVLLIIIGIITTTLGLPILELLSM